MKKWLRMGIIIFIIGVSLLAGTVYRSNTTKSFGIIHIDLAPNTWLPSWEFLDKTGMEKQYFLLTPREFRLEVRATTAIDVYVFDSEEIKMWEKNKTVEPCWTFKETGEDIYTLQISKRGKYMVLVYNPTDENVDFELYMTIYGVEKDLLCASIIFIITGLGFISVSAIVLRQKIHEKLTTQLKKNEI